MRYVYIPLPDTVRDALFRLADIERRQPKDQAALLILEGLARSGVLELVLPDTERDREPVEA